MIKIKKSLILPLFCVLFNLFVVEAQTQRTNLPTIYINTNNVTISNKEDYVSGTLTVVSSDSQEKMTNVSMGIRGRGNSTWWMPKKPYRMKLDKKAHFLNLTAEQKDWVFLANYADKTLIRNAVAFKISELVGMEFSPSVKFVDVVLNNVFIGNYMVTDQVELGKTRVNVEEQSVIATAGSTEITGGYLLEIDGFAGDPFWFSTAQRRIPVTVKYPKGDEINTAQKKYIVDYINDFEKRLFASNFNDPALGYRPWVDTSSLVNWYIICELTGNPDSFWSTYIYKRRSDQKLYFGPVWDFDIAFNNDYRVGDAVRKLMRSNAHVYRDWIEQFWRDEWFQKAVAKRWKELVDAGIEKKLLDYISETSVLLRNSQIQNFNKWEILPTRVHYELFLFDTYAKGLDYLKSYISERVAFLTECFAPLVPEEPSVPFVADENYYYVIVNKNSHNAIDIYSEEENLLTLWEIRMDRDEQLWKIEPLGNNYYRFVNKHSGTAIAGNGVGNRLKLTQKNALDDTQKWEIIPLFTGNIYGIINKYSNCHINNAGGSLDNDALVIEYEGHPSESLSGNRQWLFQKKEVITPLVNPSSVFALSYQISDRTLWIYDIPAGSNVSVFNLQNQCIYSEKNKQGDLSVAMPQQGVYILRVQNEDGAFMRKLLTK